MIKKVLPFVVLLSVITTVTVHAQWKSDSVSNTAVCTALNGQQNPQACSDGSNGIFHATSDITLDLSGATVPQYSSVVIDPGTGTADRPASAALRAEMRRKGQPVDRPFASQDERCAQASAHAPAPDPAAEALARETAAAGISRARCC